MIINFHEMKLTDGLVRMILPGANHEEPNRLTEGNEGNEENPGFGEVSL